MADGLTIEILVPNSEYTSPKATGFFVYQADLTIDQVQDQAAWSQAPVPSPNSTAEGFSPDLPLAAYAVAFAETDRQVTAIVHRNRIAAESKRLPRPNGLSSLGVAPAGLSLLGVALAGLAIFRHRRTRQAAQ